MTDIRVRHIEADGQSAGALYEALALTFSIPAIGELANWELEEFYSQWDIDVFSGPVVYRDWRGNVLIVTDTSRREIHVRFIGDLPDRVSVDYGERGSSRAAGQTIAWLRERGVAAKIRHLEEDMVFGWYSTPQKYPASTETE